MPTVHLSKPVRLLPVLLLLVSLACSLPVVTSKPTPSLPAAAPTSTARPPTPTPAVSLPPGIVEISPPPGAELPLQGALTLYFSQAMDRASVEAALSSQPGIQSSYSWVNDSALTIQPKAPLPPASDFVLGLGPGARSAQGLALDQPLSLQYRTADFLQLTQQLPTPGSSEVNPTSAVVAAFNQPVVPLGADPNDLPPAFNLQPASPGRGEWVNTSTFIFYPEPALGGGKDYSVQMNPDLHSAGGSPLGETPAWSFSTGLPRLEGVAPAPGAGSVPLDSTVVLTFTQPMDPSSVEAGLSVQAQDGSAVPGTASWNENLSVLTFLPNDLLIRDNLYSISLSGDVQASGGASLGDAYSSSFTTVPQLAVSYSEPPPGGQVVQYQGIILHLSAPIDEKTIPSALAVSPAIANMSYWWSAPDSTLQIYGEMAPSQEYHLSLSTDLKDVWGEPLSSEYALDFRTGSAPPSFFVSPGSQFVFVTPQEVSLPAQATNAPKVSVSVGSVPLQDFLKMLAPGGYDLIQGYHPADQKQWQQALNTATDQSQPVEVYLSPDQSPLKPGVYLMRLSFAPAELQSGPYLLVVSDVQTTFKHSPSDALVWAVDLQANTPLPGAAVSIYNEAGAVQAQGQTDQNGLFAASIPPAQETYQQYAAVVGQPGESDFSIGLSSWSQGIDPWSFGVPVDLNPPGPQVYLYSDRPIYRPGQTIYFRAVARQANNGRYTLLDQGTLPLALTGPSGEQLASFDLPLTAFGSAHGEFTLPESSQPGYYALQSSLDPYAPLSIQVADYRKPEINLNVSLAPSDLQYGEALAGEISAQYFFGAPAGNASVHWALYAAPDPFYMPDYQVGVADANWWNSFSFPVYSDPLGRLLSEGDERTAPDGSLSLTLPTTQEGQDPPLQRQRYTLEVTLKDESGFPVSARAMAAVHPAGFYIGLKPDAWIGQSGKESGFGVQVVDWEGEPAGAHNLRAEFQKVTWDQKPPEHPYESVTFVPRYEALASTDFSTGADGKARLAFTPTEPGTYRLYVSGEGAASEALLWVGGPGQAIWPNQSNEHLRLTADQAGYQPGDTAHVFIPNPFPGDALALLTIERGAIMSSQVQTIRGSGYTLPLELSADDAPNVYLSAVLLGKSADGRPDYRLGYVNLPVEPIQQTLQVSLLSQPAQAGPGDEVTLELQVTDSGGNPVQGEFSLAVVDLAALALAEPNAPGILPAFYQNQPLSIQTALSLNAHPVPGALPAPGIGGGGGGADMPIVVRENFPDTAYWNAELVTGADGKGKVTFQLPDNLTTWRVDARGLTSDTRVGEAQSDILTSKDLLVRPVTPRFLVAGDHVQLAAIVQNNTQEDLQVQTSLQAAGVTLDDPDRASQQIAVPAGGRARLEWWGTAQSVDSADLVFSARADSAGGVLEDAARPALGALPVLNYSAPQTFSTAGVLDGAGERLELVSLPRSFDISGGRGLSLELSPSLAGSMLSSLDYLEHYPYEGTEQTLSRFLPNLEAYRALKQLGVDSPVLQANLERTLQSGLQHLLSLQQADGGWSWWQGGQSDPYISSYVLFGLSRLQQAGIPVSSDVITKAVEYLRTDLAAHAPEDKNGYQPWQLDRLAFEYFALASAGSAGSGDLSEAQSLLEWRERLNPWGQALLALTFEMLDPGSRPVDELASSLQSAAIRSSTGAHWEQQPGGYQNMHTTLSNSAVVIYALSQLDPASPLLVDAARYLMAHRQADNSWGSTFATAWNLLGLTEYIKATNDLGGDFAYGATLNGASLVSGQPASADHAAPVTANVPVTGLYPDYPNALTIQRQPGNGRLYYTASLNVNRPVAEVAPLNQGLFLERSYYPQGAACPGEGCILVNGTAAGSQVTAKLRLTLPHDAYYLVVEDYLPAGAEVLDTSLKTTLQGTGEGPQAGLPYDPADPYSHGWGQWYFHPAQVYDDHIAWTADYLPAGTYELTYTLVANQAGEYQVLPARAWQFYFPEVQGNSAGEQFSIQP